MRKGILVKLLFGIIFLACTSYLDGTAAEVSINVGIEVPPPPLVISAPPPVFVIPGTYVYFAPDVAVDLFFYHGYWYRPYRGYWYRSTSYNGKWYHVAPNRVPSVVLNLPPHFRQVPAGHHHIPYVQLKKNWKTWEKERYWERNGYGNGEREKRRGEAWDHKQGRGKQNN